MSNFPYEFALTRGYTLGAPKNLVPTEDGRIVLFLRARARDASQSLWETDLTTGQTRELLRPEALRSGPETLSAEERARRERQRISAAGFTSFQPTHDGSKIIVTLSGRLYVLTRASGEVRELPTGKGAAIDPQLSPDGTRVAYVRDHDVHVIGLDGGKELRVTQGGTEGKPNGLSEFIAQEELHRSRGFWWSPDGQEILYEEADLSPVQRLTITDPAHPEKPPEILPYPRAGTPNAIVHLAIAPVPSANGKAPASGRVRKVSWDATRYPYLATATWTKNAPPTIYVLDRVQQNGLVLAIDPKTGATHTLVTEQDSAWLNVDPSVPRWLPDGSGFLWSTERRGSWELELRDARGEPRSVPVPAAIGYRALLTVDPDKHVAYVSASSDPIRAEVWAAPLDGSAAPHALARSENGVVHAFFGEGSHTFAFVEATKQGDRRFGARSVDGKSQATIGSMAEAPPFNPQVEFTTVGVGDEKFHVAIVRPRNYDPKRRYPLIDAVYGGPHSNVVVADGLAYLRAQWIADVADAIVVAVDAHGTMWRGRTWERKLRERLGEVPLEGHVAAIGALAKAHPEIDATRVGIYGWSFGGYLTSMAILRRPDVFKVGVAGAPTVDQADYDTCYTERYLGIPPSPAYDNASLLTWAARPPTAALPARPFLLVHGTADDNVYFSNSLKLADTMGKSGRPLEFIPLVGVTHMLYAPDIAGPAWTRMANFLRDHL
ncbi:DPP IV N-terminal domain-containing protein [Pendulispora albinea]|uniref:S9 family peptidase n=1 Tax=Pendulispora albinea TaxID=2741071 RepID=A0ABZ2LNQ7_9BACT